MLETMRAAVIRQPGEVQIAEAPVPQARPGEVRIRLEGTGVCASNLPLWQGAPWFSYPMQPGQGGHEAWGWVDAVGSERDASWLGQRVAALSYNAYAEYDVARADQLVRLPRELQDRPFPGEALGCAMNIFRRSAIVQGMDVAIVGAGFLGALLTRLASRAGATVIAISRRQDALATASALGASHTLALGERRELVERVKELTQGRLCDRVIDATGKQQPLDLAGELTREHGRLVIAGYHQDGPRSVDMQLWNYRGLDVINAHERDPATCLRGIREAVEAVSAGWLDPAPLYTHEFALAELGRAFEHVRDRPQGFMKALVRVEAPR